MEKRRKRILCAVLSALLVVTSFRITPMQRVEAAALSTEATAEIFILLYELVLNAQVATGAGELIGDYESGKLTFETFMDTLAYDIMGMPEGVPLEEYGEIYLDDGTSVSIADVVTGVGDGTITIPDVELKGVHTWFVYDNLEHWSASQPPYNIDPEEPPESPGFSNIQKILLGSGAIAALADTMSKFWGGEIEGVDLSLYYDKSYTGEVRTDGVCYLYDMAIVNYYGYEYSVEDYLSDCLLCGCIEETTNMVYIYKFGVNGSAQIAPCGGYSGTSNYPYYSGLQALYTDIPLFSSREEALNYYETGDDTGCLNKAVLNRGALATKLPSIMAPIAGVQLAPSAMQDMYSKMKSAYQTQIQPQIETSTDTDTNTETYAQAMTQAVTETETGTETGTGTETDPEPTPEPETEEETTSTETDIDIKDYEVDLKEIFPFCIPFDFIALLDALDAEPEAPSFEIPFVVPALEIDERYEVDLSMFDEQMEVVRTFETIGFIVLLMHLTSKFIKW